VEQCLQAVDSRGTGERQHRKPPTGRGFGAEDGEVWPNSTDEMARVVAGGGAENSGGFAGVARGFVVSIRCRMLWSGPGDFEIPRRMNADWRPSWGDAGESLGEWMGLKELRRSAGA